jgi:dsDNA-specific endonuclease/ATPase MutS2
VRQAKQDSEQRRERAQYLENKAEEMKEEYEERLARIKEEEERTGADIGLKIQDQLEEVESAADDLYDDVRFQRKSLAKRARAIRDELREVLDRTEDLVAGREPEMPLQPGDEVYVAKVHKWGTVDRLDEKRGRATVSAGGMQLKVDIDDLVRWGNEIEGK